MQDAVNWWCHVPMFWLHGFPAIWDHFSVSSYALAVILEVLYAIVGTSVVFALWVSPFILIIALIGALMFQTESKYTSGSVREYFGSVLGFFLMGLCGCCIYAIPIILVLGIIGCVVAGLVALFSLKAGS